MNNKSDWSSRRIARYVAFVATLGVPATQALAGGVPAIDLGAIQVTADALPGKPLSASQGTIDREQFEHRPVARVGELLEAVPGLLVTQHSGSGKANQYFLRGFNLDHGTDFATQLDGVPVNMPTHAHGQGYTDINFVIPELLDTIEYRKGTYYADSGHFSAAGAARMRYVDALQRGIAQYGAGPDGFHRGVLADSFSIRAGELLYGIEHARNDGPWRLEERLRRTNAMLRYARGEAHNRLLITAMAYDNEWRATDQVPRRAIESGLIDRLGFIDGTDGGASSRYSLSANWDYERDGTEVRTLLYAVDYQLDLFSNFTYFTTPGGDQFEQLDDRRVYGGTTGISRDFSIIDVATVLSAGLEVRLDNIDKVGLYRTSARRRIGTIREDEVSQASVATYISGQIDWTDRLRTTLGARVDRVEFDVDSDNPANSGRAHDTLASPKLAAAFRSSDSSEWFANFGRGFHANDARGATIRVDPTDGVTPAGRVDPLVRATGAEIGMRTQIAPGVLISGSLWQLELDSELLFVGDGGSTEANRASRRRGIELATYWQPLDWLIMDLDLAWSHARFTYFDVAGDRIPGAVERVASLGVVANHPSGWFGGARLRYLGSAPLIEDDSARSESTSLLHLGGGYRLNEAMSVELSVFNALDARDNDITYFYESRLAGESAPIAGLHVHPVEPRTARVTLTVEF
jgi:hypothetical protein